ncbi:MAG: NmrA family transcriptional regulator [Oxalobacteraceae bacterium]|nr:MAG: NmrA family transcriptional regulator [Oxalobacteraceae bacterium]
MATTYLLTGASGNVGQAILQHFRHGPDDHLYQAVRRAAPGDTGQRWLDFEHPASFAPALQGVDVVFLLRPPQLADVARYFAPFIRACQQARVQHLVFLSVQGADQLPFIPHARLEALIAASSLTYTFIRPAYFMQNLTTLLADDIRVRHELFLPAGRALFVWVDVSDVGRAIARVLETPAAHRNQQYTITGSDRVDFGTVSRWLNQQLPFRVKYISPNLIRFCWHKRLEGVSWGYIGVLLLLHVLPRLRKAPPLTTDYVQLTGQQPQSLQDFISQHNSVWQTSALE